MLDDRYRELLAAYVDGELTARQHKAVLRLLHRSADARELLRRMQQDADALRQLPRPKLERDLAAPVVHLIRERRLHLGRRRSADWRQLNFAAWAGFSAAAAALLLVAFGSYLYFSWSLNEGPDPNAVAKGTPEPPARSTPKSPPAPSPEPKKDPQPAVAVKPPAPAPAVEEETSKPPDDAIGAPPDPIATMEMFPKVATPTSLQIVKLADLDQEPRRRQLLKDLAKEPAYRMESPVKDSIKAFERLKAALTKAGLSLAIDPTAQARMTASARLAKFKTNFVLYVEDVTPEELVQLFQHAAAEDRKAEKIRKGDTQFETVIITAMTNADRQELCTLLSVKGKKLPDLPTGPLGVDVSKPLSAKTGDDVAKALAGQGGVPRPEAGKPTAKPERLALLLPYNPVRPRPDSPEIKRFLAARKPPRPGAVQVLLVLREMGG